MYTYSVFIFHTSRDLYNYYYINTYTYIYIYIYIYIYNSVPSTLNLSSEFMCILKFIRLYGSQSGSQSQYSLQRTIGGSFGTRD